MTLVGRDVLLVGTRGTGKPYLGYLAQHLPLIDKLSANGKTRAEIAAILVDDHGVRGQVGFPFSHRDDAVGAVKAALGYVNRRRLGVGEPNAANIPGLDKEYIAARREHAVLLRCEGLTYREVGERLGVGIKRAADLVHEGGRRLVRAMRRTKFSVVLSREAPQ